MPRKLRYGMERAGPSILAMERRVKVIRQWIAAERDAMKLEDLVSERIAAAKRNRLMKRNVRDRRDWKAFDDLVAMYEGSGEGDETEGCEDAAE